MGVYNKEYESLAEAIVTGCDFYSTDKKRTFHVNRAVWDTGSTNTILSSHVVKQLGLECFRTGGMAGIGGDVETVTYLVHVALPTNDVVTYVEVMEHDFNDYDAIIGMDIITLGDFIVASSRGKTRFSFQLPNRKEERQRP